MEDPVLRSLVSKHFNSNPTTQILTVINAVIDGGVAGGHLDERPLGNERSALEQRTVEFVWELITLGVVHPGHGWDQPNLPQLTVTGYGKKCLAAGEILPHDPEGYLAKIKTRVPTLDALTELYLTEALETFRTRNHLASVVMAGVAAEQITILLTQAVQGALNGPQKSKFQKAIARQPIKRQYEEVRKRLEPQLSKMPANLKNVLTLHLDGIYDFIRRSRNEAGHPTGQRFEREEVFALLQLFPIYCDTAYRLMDWLAENQI